MNKKFFLSTVILFLVMMGLEHVSHNFIVKHQDLNEHMAMMMRPANGNSLYCWFMAIGHFIMSGAMVWIYRLGRETKPLVGQGLRFGFAIALVGAIPFDFVYFGMNQISEISLLKMLATDIVMYLIFGLLVAKLESMNWFTKNS